MAPCLATSRVTTEPVLVISSAALERERKEGGVGGEYKNREQILKGSDALELVCGVAIKFVYYTKNS